MENPTHCLSHSHCLENFLQFHPRLAVEMGVSQRVWGNSPQHGDAGIQNSRCKISCYSFGALLHEVWNYQRFSGWFGCSETRCRLMDKS